MRDQPIEAGEYKCCEFKVHCRSENVARGVEGSIQTKSEKFGIEVRIRIQGGILVQGVVLYRGEDCERNRRHMKDYLERFVRRDGVNEVRYRGATKAACQMFELPEEAVKVA